MYKNKTVITISAIRPDVIRFAHIFRKLDETFNHIQIHTGQHFDFNLRDKFYQDLNLRQPDYILTSGAPNRPHYLQEGICSQQLIELIKEKNLKPDIIIFLGDSNSVLSSIPLKKEGYKIGHVEGLMRSGDMRMAEEINRICCDVCSDLIFTYHENYKQKGLKEGISEDRIFVVGNTIVEVVNEVNVNLILEDTYWINPTKRHIIVDIHRPENFKYENRMRKIISLADELSEIYSLPIKMLDFPRTTQYLKDFNITLPPTIELIPLMGYIDFIKAQMESPFIISDSGTAQEEPSNVNIPVLVPRDFSERIESVTANNSLMISANYDNLYTESTRAIKWLDNWTPKSSDTTWLRNGLKDGETTSQKIVNILKEKL